MKKTVKRFFIFESVLIIVYVTFLILCRVMALKVSGSPIFAVFQLIVLLST